MGVEGTTNEGFSLPSTFAKSMRQTASENTKCDCDDSNDCQSPDDNGKLLEKSIINPGRQTVPMDTKWSFLIIEYTRIF